MKTLAYISRAPRTLACACLLCLLLCLTGCPFANGGWGSDKGTLHPTRNGAPYYDNSFFSFEDGRYLYDDGNLVVGKTGIDVSDHQGEIDWGAVAADGIEFAMLRVGYRGNTEGGLYADEYFEYNLEQAHAAGIECGAYFYSQAVSAEEAQKEAAFTLSMLGGQALEYPVAFDYEVSQGGRIAHVDNETASDAAEAFCSAIRAGGYAPMVYGNSYDLARFDYERIADSALWFAEYDEGPSYERKADIWQYTSKGSVAGIAWPVDVDLDLSSVPAE